MRKEGCEDGQRRKLARRETGVKKVFSTKTTKHKSQDLQSILIKVIYPGIEVTPRISAVAAALPISQEVM